VRYQATVVQSAGVASQLGKIDIAVTSACVMMHDKKTSIYLCDGCCWSLLLSNLKRIVL